MLLSIRWKLAWIGYLYKVISGETDSDTVAVHRTNWLLKQKYEGAQNMVGESVDAFIKLPAQKFGKQWDNIAVLVMCSVVTWRVSTVLQVVQAVNRMWSQWVHYSFVSPFHSCDEPEAFLPHVYIPWCQTMWPQLLHIARSEHEFLEVFHRQHVAGSVQHLVFWMFLKCSDLFAVFSVRITVAHNDFPSALIWFWNI